MEIEILENFHFRTTPDEWLKRYDKPIKAGETLSREWSYRRDRYDFLDGGRLLTILQLNRIKRECKALGYDVEYTIHKTVSKGTGWKRRRYYGKITVWFTVKGSHPKTAYEREQEKLQAIMNGEGFRSILSEVVKYLCWAEDSKIHLQLDPSKTTSYYIDNLNRKHSFKCRLIVTGTEVKLQEYRYSDESENEYSQSICGFKGLGYAAVEDQDLEAFSNALALSLKQYSDNRIDKWEVTRAIQADSTKFGWSKYAVSPIAKTTPVTPKRIAEPEPPLRNMW